MSRTMFPGLNSQNGKIALVEGEKNWTYAELNQRIECLASGLLNGKADLLEERVAFYMPASLDYVTTLHGVWRAGGIAVPLNVASAVSELEHYLTCAGVTRVIASGKYREALVDPCARLDIELVSAGDVLAGESGELPDVSAERRAMIVFTSGTTSKPKGVVSTHKTIVAQITTLIDAWYWTADDVIPLFLPLHHVHGIINVLSCGLWSGATVHLFARFDLPKITAGIAAGTYNLFMAVPTNYVKLIQYFDTLNASGDETAVKKICDGFNAMRLNISGSAACPVKLFNEWHALTGQVLLERYGMTEIGMGISNPYHGERRPGHVGQPLPGVEVQLVDEDGNTVTADNVPGEIRVRGDNVFLEYWDNEKATAESFVDGWFCTGDVAVIDDGYYRILGRSSIDIIKSGGYKLSALEIEGVLLTHDDIEEVAVIGVEDETWGEVVAAFVVLRQGADLQFGDLKTWCKDRMSSYKIPKSLKLVTALPRNAMGKVTKPDLKKRV